MKMKFTLSLLLLCLSYSPLKAQVDQWHYVRPDNTGTGGDYHDVITQDLQGNIWFGGFMVFYEYGSAVKFDGVNTFVNFGNYDGYLPDERVTDIVFDQHNYPWIGTERGIARYTGTSWIHYSFAAGTLPLPYEYIMGMEFDSQQNLWVTFGDINQYAYGYAKFDGTNWTYTMGTEFDWLPLNNNFALRHNFSIDAQDNKWIPSSQGLIRIAPDGSWQLLDDQNSNRSGQWAGDSHYDRSTGLLWVTSGVGLDSYNGTTWTNYTSWPDPNYQAVYVYVRGNKKIVSDISGFATVLIDEGNGAGWTTHNLSNVEDVFIDNGGNFWVAGSGYIAKWNGTQWKKWTRFTNGLNSYSNFDLFIDSKNIKWFANGNGGVQNFNCPQWQAYGPFNEGHYPSPQSLSPIGTSVCEDSQGNIWMAYDGTFGYAVKIDQGNYNDPAAHHLYETSNVDFDFQIIEETEATTDGKVFFRTGQEIIFVHDLAAGSWQKFTNPAGVLPFINCMSAGPNGTMYLGGYNKIVVYNNDSWSVIDMELVNPAIENVMDIKFDENGDMWVGTQAGVWRYTGSAWINYNMANAGIASDYVKTIAIGNGKVYIGAYNVFNAPYYGGISIFDGTGWTSILQPGSGLPHKQVEDLGVDTLGNLWILAQSEAIAVYNENGVVGFNCEGKTLNPLPVTLTSFSATKFKETDAMLRWIADETDGLRYDIERSTDGRNFRKIGEALAQNIPNASYSFVDENPLPGRNYYRLKIIRSTGNISHSRVAMLIFGDSAPAISVYPNPVVNGRINISMPGADDRSYSWKLFAADGKLISGGRVAIISGTGHISSAPATTGVYILELQSGTDKTQLRIMIK